MYDPISIAQIIGFGGFIWVGLYVLVRTPRLSPLIIIGLVGLFSQAIFFGWSALTDGITSHTLFMLFERLFWWSAVVPIASWFHFSSLIARQVQQRDDEWAVPIASGLVVAVYVVAAVLIILGSLTNMFNDYDRITPTATGGWAMTPGFLYPVYIAYNGLVATGALINFAHALRMLRAQPQLPRDQSLADQLKLLIGGAVLFLIGAVWIASGYNWGLSVSFLPGSLCLLSGLALIGYGVAHFGLLLEGHNIQRDFIYNLTGIVLLNLLYVGLLFITNQQSVLVILALVGIVTLTHTAFDNGRAVLDTFFFSQDERVARAEAREYATTLGTAPVASRFAGQDEPPEPDSADEDSSSNDTEPPLAPAHADPALAVPPQTNYMAQVSPTPKKFKDAVRRAVTNLKNPPQLAKSPLLALKLVEQRLVQSQQQDNRLNRAGALRELLIEQIEALQPNDTASSHTGDAWRFYNVLYYPYVREISRKHALTEIRRLSDMRQRVQQPLPGDLEQVLCWLVDIDENTFYKWQRRASDSIATLLWEEEEKSSLGTREIEVRNSAQERTPPYDLA